MAHKVLIADDDVSLLMALAIRFRAQGWEVVTSCDSYQALAQATSQKPDVIILDINMPCGDGFTVHDRLRKMSLVSTPVIYLTGDKSPRASALSRQLGAFGLIHKPFDQAQLMEMAQSAATFGQIATA